MLKTLVAKLRTAPPEPIVWWGRHRDIWLDTAATDHGWYCGHCGHNRSQYRSGTDAKSAAHEHASAHDGVTVALWT